MHKFNPKLNTINEEKLNTASKTTLSYPRYGHLNILCYKIYNFKLPLVLFYITSSSM